MIKHGSTLRRAGLLIYCIISVVIALNAVAQMYVSFAPSRVVLEADPKIQDSLWRAEMDGIERVRQYWIEPVMLASSVLAINSVVLAVAAWR